MNNTDDYLVEVDPFEDAVDPREEALVKIDAFGQALAKTRAEAISARAASGIESEWEEDLEAYEGIDDANRESVNGKPTSPDGGSIASPVRSNRSRVYLNITRPYVDAAAAKIADMLLPTDEDNFSIDPTPIPEVERMMQDNTQLLNPQTLNPQQKTVETPQGGQVTTPYTVKDRAAEVKRQAADAVDRAKTRIRDWHVECGYNDEFRKVIEDGALLGTGVLKGPFPVATSSKIVLKEGGLTRIEFQKKVCPASKRIDPRNFFPDPSCGDNIHRGNFVWERDVITGRSLRELIDDPSYIPENIQRALEDGPGTKKMAGANNTSEFSDKSQFEIWYYYGFADHKDLEASGCPCAEGEFIPALVVMVNDLVIKATLSPQESGDFPFDVFVWQAKRDTWTGVGVSRHIRTPQRMVNGATRGMMDNAGLSTGPQIVMRRNKIVPADGVFEITPRKLWFASEDSDNRPVSDVISSISIDSRQPELLSIVQFALKMAEDVTGLPMILQGQQGKAPDTVGGMTMLTNNASTVLRRLARNADSLLIKPHVRRYYEWLLEDPDVPEDEKGDFKVDARGSSALVERDIHNQILAQAIQFSLNPAFELNPARSLKEYLSSQRIDVRKLEYTDEEKQRLAEAQSQAPQDPRLIAAQANVQAAQIRSEADVARAQAQAQANQVEISARMQDAAEDRAYRERELNLMRDIEIMKLASSEKVSLDKIKAQLTDTSIREKNKRDLASAEMALKRSAGSGI